MRNIMQGVTHLTPGYRAQDAQKGLAEGAGCLSFKAAIAPQSSR